MRLAKHLSHVQLRVQGMHIMFSKMKFKSFQTKFNGCPLAVFIKPVFTKQL